MTTSTPTVLVLGGTGRTGSHLVAKLTHLSLACARRRDMAPESYTLPNEVALDLSKESCHTPSLDFPALDFP
jgi:nucleoside-diphosphate-sugar epimerase